LCTAANSYAFNAAGNFTFTTAGILGIVTGHAGTMTVGGSFIQQGGIFQACANNIGSAPTLAITGDFDLNAGTNYVVNSAQAFTANETVGGVAYAALDLSKVRQFVERYQALPPAFLTSSAKSSVAFWMPSPSL